MSDNNFAAVLKKADEDMKKATLQETSSNQLIVKNASTKHEIKSQVRLFTRYLVHGHTYGRQMRNGERHHATELS